MTSNGANVSPLEAYLDVFLFYAADERQRSVLKLAPEEMGRKESILVGLSCLLMGAPAVWGISMGFVAWGITGCCVAIFSCLSDFVFLLNQTHVMSKLWFALGVTAMHHKSLSESLTRVCLLFVQTCCSSIFMQSLLSLGCSYEAFLFHLRITDSCSSTFGVPLLFYTYMHHGSSY